MRGQTSPEVWRVTFEDSTNGVTWTSLGNGTRISGGWQLTGLSLPLNVNHYVRARGYAAVTGYDADASLLESVQMFYLASSPLYANFSGNGVWMYNGTAWSEVNAVAPSTMVASGSLLYGDFGVGGLWQWNGTAWSEVNAVAPSTMVASGSILYGDFGVGGLWQWNGTAWSEVNAVAPSTMVASGSLLYGDFGVRWPLAMERHRME